MTKVITYGTYDLLHYGHIRLLERAKALGDYLIVGVTSDDYDKTRGKINNYQSLMERVLAVKALRIADEVIVEEYEGQKIDDIRRYDIDIFAIGSDWLGKFDYIKEYCKVVYLPRTEGVSSSEIRAERNKLRVGLVGEQLSRLTSLDKFMKETPYVNGIEVVASNVKIQNIDYIENYSKLLEKIDAVYITSQPEKHYTEIKEALNKKKHVLCESPVTLNRKETEELFELAAKNKCILMEGIKTAYTTAYERLLLLLKTGKIGKVISVDATCTSLSDLENFSEEEIERNWNSITEWGTVALLPVFQILGTSYKFMNLISKSLDNNRKYDVFTKIDFVYENAVASVKVAKGAKSEGELVITGTKGYIYVPAPWWKMDYFEVRYENQSENKRYFYQLEGEGIRYEIVSFVKNVESEKTFMNISKDVTIAIANVMEEFYNGSNVTYLED